MTNLWPRTLAEAEEWGLKGIMPPRELRPAPTHDGGRKQYAKCVALMDKGDIEGLELFEVRGEPKRHWGNEDIPQSDGVTGIDMGGGGEGTQVRAEHPRPKVEDEI